MRASIFEQTRIRLGSVKKGPAEDFLEDLVDMSEEHPFDSNQRIIGGASVGVSRAGGNIRLHDITSLDPRKGHASAAMRLLISLAEEHGVDIELTAKAFSDRPNALSTEQLVAWYEKLGFEPIDDQEDIDNGVDMRYSS